MWILAGSRDFVVHDQKGKGVVVAAAVAVTRLVLAYHKATVSGKIITLSGHQSN
jgi:hypothetical protein